MLCLVFARSGITERLCFEVFRCLGPFLRLCVCSGMALVKLFLCFETLFMFGMHSTMQVKKKNTHNIMMFTNEELLSKRG